VVVEGTLKLRDGVPVREVAAPGTAETAPSAS
jgi:hypothetical protein